MLMCWACCAEVTEQLVIRGQPSFNPLMLSALKGYKHSSVAWNPFMEVFNSVGKASGTTLQHDCKGCDAGDSQARHSCKLATLWIRHQLAYMGRSTKLACFGIREFMAYGLG